MVNLACHEHNPIFLTAVRMLHPNVDSLYLRSSTDAAVNEMQDLQVEATQRRLRVRNRFWLWVMLSQNPSLQEFRWFRNLAKSSQWSDSERSITSFFYQGGVADATQRAAEVELFDMSCTTQEV
eukprot:gnl/MRDRNA2_/MRDRNA2_313940_c0_seq1.p1 gnl/MRDRNA2_/MRDRNA2_313940_c0~~gnl/MRDRNA2_/MRDRNA2_313940_c0_seq1.p1  ORF type:complete len:138 (+),score=17.10 gnl/MRDRNA2_/MRDRNA2_313940_c0_seq1:43-414(+)